MAYENPGYDERGRKRDARLARNESLLREFSDWLENKGISQKTIDKHLVNVRIFLDEYLLIEDVESLEDAVIYVNDYMGRYLIERQSWNCGKNVRESITSLKKFFRAMLELGEVDDISYAAFLEDIRWESDGWRVAARRREEEYRNEKRWCSGRVSTMAPTCSKCQSPNVLVFLDGEPYCKDCYNRHESERLGVEHFTDDILGFRYRDADGRTMRFEVEHMLFGPQAKWTAREVVEPGDKRRKEGYEGIEVELLASSYDSPAAARSALDAKVAKRMRLQSLEVLGPHVSGIERGGNVLMAAERGMARLEEADDGGVCVVVDGWRFTADDFLRLMSSYVGFDLVWEIQDASFGLPWRWPEAHEEKDAWGW